MASFLISYMPNSITNYATSVADTLPLSPKQDHLPLLRSNDPFTTTPSCPNQTIVSQFSRSISSKFTTSNLASVWREIQGSNNWENLVDPLAPLLRTEIIRYGEFVNACYKAFDLDPTSKRYLSCKFGKKTMLKEVGLLDSGYEVTKYIYATAPDISIPIQPGSGSHARWVGYVAVSEDEEVIQRLGRRDIVVTFRGTVTTLEWIANLMTSLTPAQLDPFDPRPDVKVEAGFLSLYTSKESNTKFGVGSCRDQLLAEVSRLLSKYKDDKISVTLVGHSMGSSLALLLAYDMSELGLNIPITVFSFAGPRVGNLGFKERCDELGVKVLRIVNVNDPITKLPGVLFNENFKVFPWRHCSCYAHVGVELLLDFFKMHNPSCVHDLESYIGLLKSCSENLKKKVGSDEGLSLVGKAKGLLLNIGALDMDGVLWVHYGVLCMVNLVPFLCI